MRSYVQSALHTNHACMLIKSVTLIINMVLRIPIGLRRDHDADRHWFCYDGSVKCTDEQYLVRYKRNGTLYTSGAQQTDEVGGCQQWYWCNSWGYISRFYYLRTDVLG